MPVEILRPNATEQLGSWTVSGAATAHQALNDASDTSYVQLITRCRNEPQVLRLNIGDLTTVPTGAKIFSVGERIRIQCVVNVRPPRCIRWHRRCRPFNIVTAIVLLVFRILFGWPCPRRPTVVWVDQVLGYSTTDPEGNEWTVDAVNDLDVDLGRDDADTTPLRISALYVDVTFNQRPSASVSTPTGTITDTSRPTVTWVYSDPESDPQQAFRVRIFNSAQYSAVGFDPLTSPSVDDSGWVMSDLVTWTGDVELVNATYRAYVQVEQAWAGLGQHRSLVTFSQWTQNVAGAPNPQILISDFEPAQNRVRLVVAPGGTTPATVSYTIFRSDDAGVTWAPVRGGVQIPADGMNAVELYDYEAPLNLLVQYRAVAFRQLGSLRFVSDYSNVISVVCDVVVFWLKDPLAPALNMVLPISASGADQPSRPRAQGVFTPLVADGLDARAIVINGPLYGLSGSLELIFTQRDPEGDLWTAFNGIYRSGRTLLLQYPTGEQHYVALGGDLSWTWDLVRTDVRWRRAQIGYTEVEKPPIE